MAVPGLHWQWTARLHRGASVKTIKSALPGILRWCEDHGVLEPEVRAWSQHAPGFDVIEMWLDRNRVSIHGRADASGHEGVVWALPSGHGGAAGDLTGVSSWFEAEIVGERTMRKVEKLRATGLQDLQLFLVVDDSGAPFAGFYAMAFTDAVPDVAIDPGDLTSVWVLPRWSPAVLRWSRESGWTRHVVADNLPG